MFFAGHTTSPIRPSVVAADICLVCVENTLVLSREEVQLRLPFDDTVYARKLDSMFLSEHTHSNSHQSFFKPADQQHNN